MKNHEFQLKVIMTAGFVVYLYVLIKLILFKWGSIDLHILYYQFQSALHQPKRIFEGHGNYIPFKEIIRDIQSLSISNPIPSTNLIGNIMAFIPLGIFIPRIFSSGGMSFIKVFVLSLLVSLCFEVTQLILFIGIFDVDDLILNTFGGIIGYGALRLFMIIKPKGQEQTNGNLKKAFIG